MSPITLEEFAVLNEDERAKALDMTLREYRSTYSGVVRGAENGQHGRFITPAWKDAQVSYHTMKEHLNRRGTVHVCPCCLPNEVYRVPAFTMLFKDLSQDECDKLITYLTADGDKNERLPALKEAYLAVFKVPYVEVVL